MTIKAAKAILAPLGVTINSRPETGEYRVNLVGGTEATACYETDLDGAVATGKAMAHERMAASYDNELTHKPMPHTFPAPEICASCGANVACDHQAFTLMMRIGYDGNVTTERTIVEQALAEILDIHGVLTVGALNS